MSGRKDTLNQDEIHQTLQAYVQNNKLNTTTAHQIETHLQSFKQSMTADQLNALIQTFTTLTSHYKQAKKNTPTTQPKNTQTNHTTPPPTKKTQHTQPQNNQTSHTSPPTIQKSQSTEELNIQMRSIQNQLNNLVTHQEAWKNWIEHNTTTKETNPTEPHSPQTPTVFTTTHMQTLSQIPKHPEGIIVLMRWLQYLVETCGHNGLPEILDYYVDIEWITEDVRLDLMKYARGITEPDTKTKQNTLTTKDHIQTLLYLQRLNGIDYDDHFLERIDWQMEKLGRDLEESYNRRTRKQN